MGIKREYNLAEVGQKDMYLLFGVKWKDFEPELLRKVVTA